MRRDRSVVDRVTELLVLVLILAYGGRLVAAAVQPVVPYAVGGLILIGVYRWLFARY